MKGNVVSLMVSNRPKSCTQITVCNYHVVIILCVHDLYVFVFPNQMYTDSLVAPKSCTPYDLYQND